MLNCLSNQPFSIPINFLLRLGDVEHLGVRHLGDFGLKWRHFLAGDVMSLLRTMVILSALLMSRGIVGCKTNLVEAGDHPSRLWSTPPLPPRVSLNSDGWSRNTQTLLSKEIQFTSILESHKIWLVSGLRN